MAVGPGRYDDLATYVRVKSKAAAVVVIVARGDRGDGFSVQCGGIHIASALPAMLRMIADGIEKDLD
jgi:hypothetical protein